MSYLGNWSLTLRRHFFFPTLLAATLVPAVANAADGATPSLRGEALPLGLMGAGLDEGPGASLPLREATPIKFSVDWSGDGPRGLRAYYSLSPNVSVGGWTGVNPLSADFGAGLALKLEF